MTISNTKTGIRIDKRTPDQPEIFMDELLCQYKFTSFGICEIKGINLVTLGIGVNIQARVTQNSCE